MLPKGGTLLGHPAGQPVRPRRRHAAVQATFRDMGLDALVVIGGNGSLSVACMLHRDFGLPIVGVPKTIDNDVVGTDLTFGFTTAVQIATDAIDRLHTTAESHDRVMVVEVMGRHAGWIATYAGIAGGATVILIPEEPFDIDEVCEHLRAATSAAATRRSSSSPRAPSPVPGTLPMPEKLYDQFGHVRLGGIGRRRSPTPSRSAPVSRPGSCMLGHVQRGGTPTAFDRVLSTRYGVAAIDAVHDGAWGQMAVLRARGSRWCRWPRRWARPAPSTSTSTTTSPRSSSAEPQRQCDSGAAGSEVRRAVAPWRSAARG